MNKPQTPADLLDDAYDLIVRAMITQRADADPAHEDFYVYGHDLQVIPTALAEFTERLAAQVSSYGERYVLRDDSGGRPEDRIATAIDCLQRLHAKLHDASRYAAEYHNAIAHIGVTGKRGGRR